MEEIIRVVVYEEDGTFFAQCLEYDIMASSNNIDDLNAEIHRAFVNDMCVSHSKYGEFFAKIKPAPDRFFEMWNELASAEHVGGTWRRVKTASIGQKNWDVQYLGAPILGQMQFS